MENAFEINCTNLLSDIFLMKGFCLVKMSVFHVMVFIRLQRTKTKLEENPLATNPMKDNL